MDNQTIINTTMVNETNNVTMTIDTLYKNTTTMTNPTKCTEEAPFSWTEFQYILVGGVGGGLIMGIFLGGFIIFCCLKKRYSSRYIPHSPKGGHSAIHTDPQFVERLRVQYARNATDVTATVNFDLHGETCTTFSQKHGNNDKSSPTFAPERGKTRLPVQRHKETQTDPPRKYSLAKVLRSDVSIQTDISRTSSAQLETDERRPNNTDRSFNYNTELGKLSDIFLASRVINASEQTSNDRKTITIFDDFPFKKFMESKIPNFNDSIKSNASYVLPDGILPPTTCQTDTTEDEDYVNTSTMKRNAKHKQPLTSSDDTDETSEDYINVIKFKKTAPQKEQIEHEHSNVENISNSSETNENVEQFVLLKLTDDLLSSLLSLSNPLTSEDSDDGDDYVPMNQGLRKNDDMYIAMSGGHEANYVNLKSDPYDS